MSHVSYDLDTSGGLMPVIKALIKPPDEDGNGQKSKKPQHPYYKRPGKGHNHDSCDACGEGGDLICCDRCPASFHLGCYDPPLDENDIPTGLWLCRECRASDAEQATSSKSSCAQSPTDKTDTEKKTRTLRNRVNSKKRSKDESEGEEEEKEKEKEKEVNKEEVEKELSPMEILVKAAKIMNPTQFQLPREMQVPCIFPGTEKEGSKNGAASVVSVDAWGCVPLPARSCHVCAGTCKAAPLLQCDYCPLLFHQDCLDPPLTALPTGRWMCPNHVEKFIDWKLVNSVSLTERVALWDKFTAPVDQHAIKIDFIRRARKHNPMFRMKIAGICQGRVIVPPAVRRHYAAPPPLLPSRREYVRCHRVLQKLKQTEGYSSSDDEGPKHAVCLDLHCTENHNKTSDKYDDGDNQDEKDKKDQHSDASSSELSDSDFESVNSAVKKRKLCAPRVRVCADDAADELLAAADEQLQKIDDKLIRLLAWQRLQQVLAGERTHGSHRHTPLSAAAERVVLRALPPHRRPLAARPSELLSRADRERISCAVWGAAVSRAAAPCPAPDYSLQYVRAVMCPARNDPIEAAGRPVAMRLATLTIGSDSGCDVRLDATLCRNVSRNHAVIFMDEVTRHFELLNYSEWGSVVNGVSYACDVSAAAAPPRAHALHDIVRRRAPRTPRVNGDLTSESGLSQCKCRAAAAAGAWEGSALVPHAALLSFGCFSFVFSIVDSPEQPDEPAL